MFTDLWNNLTRYLPHDTTAKYVFQRRIPINQGVMAICFTPDGDSLVYGGKPIVITSSVTVKMSSCVGTGRLGVEIIDFATARPIPIPDYFSDIYGPVTAIECLQESDRLFLAIGTHRGYLIVWQHCNGVRMCGIYLSSLPLIALLVLESFRRVPAKRWAGDCLCCLRDIRGHTSSYFNCNLGWHNCVIQDWNGSYYGARRGHEQNGSRYGDPRPRRPCSCLFYD